MGILENQIEQNLEDEKVATMYGLGLGFKFFYFGSFGVMMFCVRFGFLTFEACGARV